VAKKDDKKRLGKKQPDSSHTAKEGRRAKSTDYRRSRPAQAQGDLDQAGEATSWRSCRSARQRMKAEDDRTDAAAPKKGWEEGCCTASDGIVGRQTPARSQGRKEEDWRDSSCSHRRWYQTRAPAHGCCR